VLLVTAYLEDLVTSDFGDESAVDDADPAVGVLELDRLTGHAFR
jgi:hypothetical protein